MSILNLNTLPQRCSSIACAVLGLFSIWYHAGQVRRWLRKPLSKCNNAPRRQLSPALAFPPLSLATSACACLRMLVCMCVCVCVYVCTCRCVFNLETIIFSLYYVVLRSDIVTNRWEIWDWYNFKYRCLEKEGIGVLPCYSLQSSSGFPTREGA